MPHRTVKTFEYAWDNDIYLLHVQFDNPTGMPFTALVIRQFVGGATTTEEVSCHDGQPSHRVMVSRSHPRETGLKLEYPRDLVVQVYELDDRAYFPDEPIFRA